MFLLFVWPVCSLECAFVEQMPVLFTKEVYCSQSIYISGCLAFERRRKKEILRVISFFFLCSILSSIALYSNGFHHLSGIRGIPLHLPSSLALLSETCGGNYRTLLPHCTALVIRKLPIECLSLLLSSPLLFSIRSNWQQRATNLLMASSATAALALTAKLKLLLLLQLTLAAF